MSLRAHSYRSFAETLERHCLRLLGTTTAPTHTVLMDGLNRCCRLATQLSSHNRVHELPAFVTELQALLNDVHIGVPMRIALAHRAFFTLWRALQTKAQIGEAARLTHLAWGQKDLQAILRTDTDILLKMMRMVIQAGEFKTAQEISRAYWYSSEQTPEKAIQILRMLYEMGAWNEYDRHYQSVLSEMDRMEPLNRLRTIEIGLHGGLKKEALAVLSLLEEARIPADQHPALAMTYLALGQIEQARRLIITYPSHPGFFAARRLLARIDHRFLDPADSQLPTTPPSSRAEQSLHTLALLDCGLYDTAETFSRRLLVENPDDFFAGLAAYSLAQLALHRSDWPTASARFQQATALTDGTISSRHWLWHIRFEWALLARQLAKPLHALEIARAGHELFPRPGNACTVLCLILETEQAGQPLPLDMADHCLACASASLFPWLRSLTWLREQAAQIRRCHGQTPTAAYGIAP